MRPRVESFGNSQQQPHSSLGNHSSSANLSTSAAVHLPLPANPSNNLSSFLRNEHRRIYRDRSFGKGEEVLRSKLRHLLHVDSCTTIEDHLGHQMTSVEVLTRGRSLDGSAQQEHAANNSASTSILAFNAVNRSKRSPPFWSSTDTKREPIDQRRSTTTNGKTKTSSCTSTSDHHGQHHGPLLRVRSSGHHMANNPRTAKRAQVAVEESSTSVGSGFLVNRSKPYKNTASVVDRPASSSSVSSSAKGPGGSSRQQRSSTSLITTAAYVSGSRRTPSTKAVASFVLENLGEISVVAAPGNSYRPAFQTDVFSAACSKQVSKQGFSHDHELLPPHDCSKEDHQMNELLLQEPSKHKNSGASCTPSSKQQRSSEDLHHELGPPHPPNDEEDIKGTDSDASSFDDETSSSQESRAEELNIENFLDCPNDGPRARQYSQSVPRNDLEVDSVSCSLQDSSINSNTSKNSSTSTSSLRSTASMMLSLSLKNGGDEVLASVASSTKLPTLLAADVELESEMSASASAEKSGLLGPHSSCGKKHDLQDEQLHVGQSIRRIIHDQEGHCSDLDVVSSDVELQTEETPHLHREINAIVFKDGREGAKTGVVAHKSSHSQHKKKRHKAAQWIRRKKREAALAVVHDSHALESTKTLLACRTFSSSKKKHKKKRTRDRYAVRSVSPDLIRRLSYFDEEFVWLGEKERDREDEDVHDIDSLEEFCAFQSTKAQATTGELFQGDEDVGEETHIDEIAVYKNDNTRNASSTTKPEDQDLEFSTSTSAGAAGGMMTEKMRMSPRRRASLSDIMQSLFGAIRRPGSSSRHQVGEGKDHDDEKSTPPPTTFLRGFRRGSYHSGDSAEKQKGQHEHSSRNSTTTTRRMLIDSTAASRPGVTPLIARGLYDPLRVGRPSLSSPGVVAVGERGTRDGALAGEASEDKIDDISSSPVLVGDGENSQLLV
ncbi:unnamed protein product [Amoebophrya sp. A25]|nr:unnamed protein product [Amoebophrya sp. A25]|eukprot:GSA25T00025886001.1